MFADKSQYFIPLGAGISDSLNPCALATVVLFSTWMSYLIAIGAGFKKFGLVFLMVSFSIVFIMSLLPFLGVDFARPLILIARVFYLILGGGFVIAGIGFLNQWRKLIFAVPQSPTSRTFPRLREINLWLATFGIAAIATMLSLSWPANFYMLLWGTLSVGPGRIPDFSLMYVVYSGMYVFPLIIIFIILWGTQKQLANYSLIGRNLSLFKIITAGILLAFGASLIYFFY